MSIRSVALALLLVCGGVMPGVAAEPDGATIVLQLPQSMSPAAIRALFADLAAKGVRPAAALDPPAARPQMRPTSAQLAGRVWDAAMRALRALPALSKAPRHWIARVEAGGGTPGTALGFWIVALAGVVAAPLIGQGMRQLLDRRQTVVSGPGLAPRLRAAMVRLLIALAGLAVFGLSFWAALLGVSSSNALLEQTADLLVWAALQWRLGIIVLIVVVASRRPDLRLLAIDDADARTCSRWLAVYAALSPLNLLLIWLVERIGFRQEAVFGTALAFGFVVTAYKLVMFWAIRYPIGRAILAATGGEPGPLRRAVAATWHWFFIVLSLCIFGGATVAFSLGKGAGVPGAAAATQGIVVVLALLWLGSQKLLAHLFADAADVPATLRRQMFRRALARLCDALLWIFGAAWLAETWGLDLVDPAPGSPARLIVRPVLLAAVTIVGAWLLWTVLSAVIDENMPHTIAPGDEDEGDVGAASRLATLLPLARNATLIGLGAIALIVALSTLGLDIGPLLAGLGIVGIAVGFGAQSLVRDIISGLFFLMEDAFRVGEYIDTGRLRGTVEGMSLRSVRLRHQNGQIHTIPFGQVQAVTNFSRDWSVIKFNLHLEPAAEIETVRKTIKRVGQELLDDPEIGGEFIQPLKMQGVVDVLQTSLVVRCKFTATPVRPTYLQRRALHRLIDAFNTAGIRFAAPNVMVQLTGAAAG